MKTLKQLREEYDNKYVTLNESSEEMVLEVKSKSLMRPDVPSVSKMPALLLFRRVSYKMYPQNQVVALYYSKMVDKYLSIPFGPTGNLNLSEASVYDTLEDLELAEGVKWGQVAKVAKRAAAIASGAGNGIVRGMAKGNAVGAEPGMVIGGVVGGIKGAYKGATRELGESVKESFRDRYHSLKEQTGSISTSDQAERERLGLKKNYGWKEKFIPGYVDQKRASGYWSKREYGSAIRAGVRSVAKKSLAALGAAAVAVPLAATAVTRAATGAGKPGLGDEVSSQTKAASTELLRDKPKTAPTKANWKSSMNPVTAAKLSAAELKSIKENKISDIRKMVNEGIETTDLQINGRSVTLNTSMAKRILEVYDSVNTKNKKIVEGMLNEDLESFKKLLNFSIRN